MESAENEARTRRYELLNMTAGEMKRFVAELGEAPFRGKQLFHWVHGRGENNFDRMTNLPAELRKKLAERAYIGGVVVAGLQEDPSDGTKKFLFELEDGNAIEGVFMKYRYGNSFCVSSQVGCRMGCVFCASALGGLVRNLTSGEMVAQVMEAERYTAERIDHIVVMGMGEPFDNYDQVKRFLQILHDPQGRNIGFRNITVSTSGLVPGIKRFTGDFPQVNLAISLHRADNEGRSRLMPVNRAYPIEELLDAAREYTMATHRRVTFEYALIRGENDREQDVRQLVNCLCGMLCHVNLIPLNNVSEANLVGSERRRAEEIARQLHAAGIPATVRRELGGGIDGACGQLRRKMSRD